MCRDRWHCTAFSIPAHRAAGVHEGYILRDPRNPGRTRHDPDRCVTGPRPQRETRVRPAEPPCNEGVAGSSPGRRLGPLTPAPEPNCGSPSARLGTHRPPWHTTDTRTEGDCPDCVLGRDSRSVVELVEHVAIRCSGVRCAPWPSWRATYITERPSWSSTDARSGAAWTASPPECRRRSRRGRTAQNA